MLLLFETAAGFALFKVLKESKLRDEQVLLTMRILSLLGVVEKHSSTRLQPCLWCRIFGRTFKALIQQRR